MKIDNTPTLAQVRKMLQGLENTFVHLRKNTVFCQFCDISIKLYTKNSLTRHIESNDHICNKKEQLAFYRDAANNKKPATKSKIVNFISFATNHQSRKENIGTF